MGSAGRSHPDYIKACKRLRVEAPSICCFCGEDIDQSLHHTHAMSWTADHRVPLSECEAMGVDPNAIENLRPAHRRCNGRAGALLQQGRAPQPMEVVQSRLWH